MDVAKTPAGKQRIQSAGLAGQDVIAQGAQDHRQVAEQLFGGTRSLSWLRGIGGEVATQRGHVLGAVEID